jgi:hypothetical protein
VGKCARTLAMGGRKKLHNIKAQQMFTYKLPLLYGKYVGTDSQLLFVHKNKDWLTFSLGTLTI